MYAERFDDPYVDLVRALYGADRLRGGGGPRHASSPHADAAAAPGRLSTPPGGAWTSPVSEALGEARQDPAAER